MAGQGDNDSAEPFLDLPNEGVTASLARRQHDDVLASADLPQDLVELLGPRQLRIIDAFGQVVASPLPRRVKHVSECRSASRGGFEINRLLGCEQWR